MAKFAGSLDASVLLRLLINDIPDRHAAAAKLLEDGRKHYAVSDIAIAELVFVLEHHYRLKRAAIQEAVEGLLALPNIQTNRVLLTEALHIYVRRGSLTFEECYMHAFADLVGAAPLWTFDKKLAHQLEGVQLVSNIDSYKSFELL